MPGAATTVTAPGGGDGAGTSVSATGQMAEGFEAEQADSTGMGLVSCSHPSSDMWFVGSGEPDVWLYLTNSGTAQASVDVTILTDTGQQSGLADAITVAPNQVIAENVSPYVHGAQAIALHVQTSSGQIAASVWEGARAGSGAWLPQAAAPSTTVVIPGLTVASSSARLFVTVPGAADAKVKVVAYTPAGAHAQFDSTTTPVQASAAATTPVTLSSLGASAAGLELTSNVPIVAGVLVPGTGIGSFTAGANPVTDQGVVAGNPATRGLTIGLLLTAPEERRDGQRQRHRLGRHRNLARRAAERGHCRRAHARRCGAATVGRAFVRDRAHAEAGLRPAVRRPGGDLRYRRPLGRGHVAAAGPERPHRDHPAAGSERLHRSPSLSEPDRARPSRRRAAPGLGQSRPPR